ncbi:MAG: hypothetical protein OEZ04_05850, partial [Nitrospinota bacterium]|nr:hypothetical protein [Nitrospinota bacterium]
GDVVTTIDGVAIANDGSIRLKEDLRVSADYMVRKRFLGDKVELGIIRNKARMKLRFPLAGAKPLIPLVYDRIPTYYIFGGMVFTPLTKNYLMEWGRSWSRNAPPKLVAESRGALVTEDRSEIVMMSNTLAHPMNAGYQDLFYSEVAKVNGEPVGDMKTLANLLDNAKGKYTLIELERGVTIVVDNERAAAAEKEILGRSGASHRASPDLR